MNPERGSAVGCRRARGEQRHEGHDRDKLRGKAAPAKTWGMKVYVGKSLRRLNPLRAFSSRTLTQITTQKLAKM